MLFFQNPNNPNIALVVLPTGAGKSGIAALAPYVLNKTKVLVITPSIVITTQLLKEFCGPIGSSFYERRGLIAPNNQQRAQFIQKGLAIKKTNQIPEMHLEYLVIANAHKFGPQTVNVNMEELPTNFDLVIVDEAHHYPAQTWRRIVDHFPNSSRIFLTATPTNQGEDILENQAHHLCFVRTRQQLVEAGVIRDLTFREVGDQEDDDNNAFEAVATEICEILDDHDHEDNTVQHQAMVLTYTRGEADQCVTTINNLGFGQVAGAFHGNTNSVDRDNFDLGLLRILVVCGKLLEGYDNPRISTVGICRNVQAQSRVLFAQFVGRCVRKAHGQDTISACVVSHVRFNQQQNFDNLDNLADVHPEDDADL